EVVERQGALDQVDGEVVDGAGAAVERPHRQRHGDPEDEPADAPYGALAEARLAPAGEEEQVDEQESNHDPDQGDDGHALTLRRTRSRGRHRPGGAATPHTTSTHPR